MRSYTQYRQQYKLCRLPFRLTGLVSLSGRGDQGRERTGMSCMKEQEEWKGIRLGEYLRDKVPLFLLQASCMMALCAFLMLTGYAKEGCVLILTGWVLVVGVWTLAGYRDRRRYFLNMGQVLEQVDQRFLLGELMPHSYRLEDRVYREMIRSSNKSVIERIRRIEDEQREYREYIESWVHEVKAPITSISLLCENRSNAGMPTHKLDAGRGKESGERLRRIALENQKVENYVDAALYYARSDEVYKDYVIQETDLQSVAEEAVMKNKYYLIQNQMQVEAECIERKVYTDRKWILFILGQLLINSAEYRAGKNPHIWIYTEKYGHGVRLIVKDNGTGIKKEELPRIFEKGFTGTNGRTKNEKATGIGLYLCRKLCRKLDIGIRAESEPGQGTEVILEFPVSSFVQGEAVKGRELHGDGGG